ILDPRACGGGSCRLRARRPSAGRLPALGHQSGVRIGRGQSQELTATGIPVVHPDLRVGTETRRRTPPPSPPHSFPLPVAALAMTRCPDPAWRKFRLPTVPPATA